MAYGGYDGSRRLGDYISAVADALSSQNGGQLSALLSVSRGSYCNIVAAGLEQNKVMFFLFLDFKLFIYLFILIL